MTGHAGRLLKAVGALAVLVAVIVGDYVAATHRRARGAPSPLERLETAG